MGKRKSLSKWTEAREAVLRQGYLKGERAAAIAQRLNTTCKAVSDKASSLGLKRPRHISSMVGRYPGLVPPEMRGDFLDLVTAHGRIEARLMIARRLVPGWVPADQRELYAVMITEIGEDRAARIGRRVWGAKR